MAPWDASGTQDVPPSRFVVVLERVCAVAWGTTARRAYRRNKAKTLINPVFLRIERWVVSEPRPTADEPELIPNRGSKTG
jgi:hypothetical protein